MSNELGFITGFQNNELNLKLYKSLVRPHLEYVVE